MIHQIQYRFRKKPTKQDINAARERWLSGGSCDGVGVRPLSWYGSSIHQAVRSGYVGHAGVVKCYHRPNRTLTDHDTRKSPSLESVWRVARLCGIHPLVIRMDRTRHGWHMIVEWSRRFRPIEVVAIQCVLGSDLRRETYNLARVFSGKARNPRWNLLFSEKL